MLYLDLMKKCLTPYIFPDGAVAGDLAGPYRFDPQKRIEGLDWPTEAETMVGVRRLNNVQELAMKSCAKRFRAIL
jgi:hypothetical protein